METRRTIEPDSSRNALPMDPTEVFEKLWEEANGPLDKACGDRIGDADRAYIAFIRALVILCEVRREKQEAVRKWSEMASGALGEAPATWALRLDFTGYLSVDPQELFKRWGEHTMASDIEEMTRTRRSTGDVL